MSKSVNKIFLNIKVITINKNETIKFFKENPMDDPTTYPGKWPDFSFLYYYDKRNEYYGIFKIKVREGKRLSHSKIVTNNYLCSLDRYLKKKGQARLWERFPILVYGSNACPGQLKNKGIDGVIPIFKATLKGFDVVYASHITKYGAIPATLTLSKGTMVNVWIALVDELQLRTLDASEGRGKDYYLVKIDLDGKETDLILENGEQFPAIFTYVSRHGAFSIDNGFVSLKAVKAKNRKFIAKDEREILCIFLNFVKEELKSYINADNGNATKIVDLFIDFVKKKHKKYCEILPLLIKKLHSKFRRECELNFEILKDDTLPITYGSIEPDFPELKKKEYVKIIPTKTREKAKGEYIIKINEKTLKKLGFCTCPLHKLLRKMGNPEYVVLVNEIDGRRFVNFGKVIVDNAVRDNCAEVDLTLRHSVGLHRYEYAKLYKAKCTYGWKLKHLIAKLFGIQYSVCRVKKGDLPDVEKNICRLERQALDDIGINNGDFCVVEGIKAEKVKSKNGEKEVWVIRSKKLRALELYPYVRERRRKLEAPTFHSRFPDCADIMDLTPDLCWIFLDAHTREELGASLCGSVRIRRSITHEIKKRFSEFALVLLITLLGTVITYGNVEFAKINGISINTFWLIILIAFLAFILIFLEIRGKIA